MFRVRYDSAGRQITFAPLDAAADDLTVLWLAARGNLFLFVGTGNGRDSRLKMALERLPSPRLERTSLDVERRLGTKPVSLAVPNEMPMDRPWRLAMRLGNAGVQVRWRAGYFTVMVYLGQGVEMEELTAALAKEWPGATVLGTLHKMVARGVGIGPVGCALPDSDDHATLRSRNCDLVTCPTVNENGLRIARQEIDSTPVAFPIPVRAQWVGATPSVQEALQSLAARWLASDPDHEVVVLDRMGWFADVSADVRVSWRRPGQYQRLNPLDATGMDTPDEYADLVLEWLEVLGVDEGLVGRSTHRFLKAMMRVWSHQSLESGDPLIPPLISMILSRPEMTFEMQLPPLAAEDAAILKSAKMHVERASLLPAANQLSLLLQQPAISVLWFPPFDSVRTSRMVVIDVVESTKAAEAFAASEWLSLRRTALDENTLALCVGARGVGRTVLQDGRATGASVLVWGQTLREAWGTDDVLRDGDLVISRTPDVAVVAAHLDVAAQKLLAQADEQATVQIAGDVASVLLDMSAAERYSPPLPSLPPVVQEMAWNDLPVPLAVVGPRERALIVFGEMAHSAMDVERIFVASSNGALPVPESKKRVTFTAADCPTINPLLPRVFGRWLWWAESAGLSDSLMKRAFAQGATTMQDILAIATEEEHSDLERLEALVKGGFWGEAEIDLGELLQKVCTGLRSTNSPLVRAFMAAAVDAGSQSFLWCCDVPSPAVLKRMRAVIYSETSVPGLPLLVLGECDDVPDEAARMIEKMEWPDALIWHNGAAQMVKLPVQEAPDA